MITDLTTLKDKVSRWVGGSSDVNFPDAVEDSIQLTEADLNYGFLSPDGRRCRGLRVPEMIKRATLAYNQKYEVNDADFLEARAVYLVNADTGAESPLSAVNEERVAQYDRLTSSCPRHYCLTGTQIRLAPRNTDESQPLRIIYYAKVPALLESATACTAVLTAYPQVYLHGALAHLEGYLIDDPRIPQWKTLFTSAVLGANAAAASRSSAYAA